MFNKEEKMNNKEAETIIGPSVKVSGDFNGNGNIIIEGTFEGNLKTSGSLYVGDKAKIKANIEAKEARFGGELNGNIKIDGHLDISSSARMTGDIICSDISIAKGAILNGNCSMKNTPTTAK